MTAYATLEPNPSGMSDMWISPGAPAPLPGGPTPGPSYLPSAKRTGASTANPAMTAASLGMGDYLPTPSVPSRGAPPPRPSSPGSSSESTIPAEVLDRVGFEFDHDGGYRYRITGGGGFEITGAPSGQGVGEVLTRGGEFGSSWQTLCDFVVAMGPAGRSPSKRPSAGKPVKTPPQPAPGQGEPAHEEPPVPRAPKGAVGGEFLSQRDNEFDEEGCSKDNQCTPTSATMAILGRMSTDAFYRRAQDLFADQGITRSLQVLKASQPEDLVVEWEYLHDDGHGSDVRGSSLNVIAAIEAWTGADASDQTAGSPRQTLEGITLPGVVGTWLTGSGHTVEIIQRNAQGIVINDPYGSCRGKDNYLRHGESGDAPPAHRWSMRPDLSGVNSEAEKRTDWGRANFFTWAEVESFSIGKWGVSTT